MKLIDKEALVAEIDKAMAEEMNLYEIACKEGDEEVSSSPIVYIRLQMLRSTIDTLEVKEVDLEEYYHEFLQKEWFGNSHVRTVSEMMAFTAKHFFELGLRTQKGG